MMKLVRSSLSILRKRRSKLLTQLLIEKDNQSRLAFEITLLEAKGQFIEEWAEKKTLAALQSNKTLSEFFNKIS